MRFVITFTVLSVFYSTARGRNRRDGLTFQNNGYNNILVAIHENVPEKSDLVESIKQSFRDASRFLYHATKRRAYFKHIQILLPSSWSDDPSYTRARLETFDNADIIVVPWDASKRNIPFVRSYAECGMPGENMQLTDKYFLDFATSQDFGLREKLLVHEWAHLRWGVFDEYPYPGTRQFYYSRRTESYEPVKCTHKVQGLILKFVRETKKHIKCKRHAGRYAKGCAFYPFPSNDKNGGVDASIMDRQWIESIKFFCDDKNHNKEASNKHNKRCSGRSVWDVITSTSDFSDGKNPPRTISDADLMPTFTVLKDHQRPAQVVFVLDKSGSMRKQNRMLRMIQAVTKFIRSELENGSYVSVVMFSSSAQVLVPLTQLNSAYTREMIIRQLPLEPDGGTSIGGGLEKAIELVSDKGAIVLVSDGKGNRRPNIDSVLPQVALSGAVVYSVAFTSASDNRMSTLSRLTQGEFYYDSNTEGSNDLDFAMTDIAKRLNRVSSSASRNSQATESFALSRRLDAGATLTRTAYLNEGLGLNTRLHITYVSETPSFNITSPSGRVYNVTSPETVVDHHTKTINLLIPGIAETGQWLFTVTNTAASVPEDFSLSFASAPTNKSEAMVLEASRSVVEDVWPPKWTIRGVVQRGNLPVTGLNVTATIDRPKASAVDLKLLDDGTGADLQKDDGVYSRYFTQFTAKGRYSISLSAVADPGQSSVMTMDPSQGASFLVDPDRPSDYIKNIREYTREIQAIPITSGVSLATSGGALEFNPPPEKEILFRRNTDIFPPGRIVDLEVVATDPNHPSVTLKWTATGDDMDEGTAAKYHINVNITVAGSETRKLIQQGDLLLGNLTYPKLSGEAERFIVRVPYDGVRNTSYVFRVAATDDAGHMGDDSNPAAAGLGSVPPLIEITTDEVTTSGTSLSASGIPTSAMPDDRVLNTSSMFTVRSTDDAGHSENVSNPATLRLGSVPPLTEVTTDEVTTPRTSLSAKEIPSSAMPDDGVLNASSLSTVRSTDDAELTDVYNSSNLGSGLPLTKIYFDELTTPKNTPFAKEIPASASRIASINVHTIVIVYTTLISVTVT